VSLSKILKAVTEVRVSTPAPRLCVVGAGEGLARVVGVLSAGARDEAGGVSAALDALTPTDFPRDQRLASRWGVVVLVADGCSAAEASPVVHAARRAGCNVVGLVETAAEAAWAREAGFFADEVARGLGDDPADKPTLENRIVDAAGDAAGNLAASLPSVRRTYCDHVVLTNAAQNGVIGVVVIIPGADMPAMIANQIRMVLKIAHAYGEELGADRAIEILSIVGTGFVLRTLARQALDFVPGFGWAVKGAIGFSGTIALGQAAIAYFEAGAPLRVSRMQRINRQVERLTSRVPGPLRRLASG
jgi:uncharacterized protein (DUF697 family)/uncharacterized membrane protein